MPEAAGSGETSLLSVQSIRDRKSPAHARFSSDSPINTKSEGLHGGAARFALRAINESCGSLLRLEGETLGNDQQTQDVREIALKNWRESRASAQNLEPGAWRSDRVKAAWQFSRTAAA